MGSKKGPDYSKANSALKPRNITTPFGKVTNSKKTTTYTPTWAPGQKDLYNTLDVNAANVTKNDLPYATNQYEGQLGNYLNSVNSLTADNIVNPQVYSAMLDLYTQPLERQYKQSASNLNSQLAAKNLLGGSYDALSNNMLNQNRDYNLNQASNLAVGSGLDATNQYLNNLYNSQAAAGNEVSSLGNLANLYQTMHSNLQSQLLQPFGYETQYQGTINPLQQQQAALYQQQANMQASQPSMLQQIMGGLAGVSNSLIPGTGGLYAGIGNAFGNPYASQIPYGGSGGSLAGTLGQFFGGGGGGNAGSILGSGFIP